MIIAKIKQPLCEKGFLAGESEKLVFVNIESMVALSKQFSADMRPLFESFDSHTTIIGPTLTALFNGFVIYGAFMVEYSNSFKTLNELLTLPEVKAIEEAISPQTFSLCIGKIQSRPYKYKATLEQYLKYLPKNHPDYASMGKAISKHNSVMSKCNMGMEQHEGQNRLIELDRMFGNIIGL